jgi:hypothetical protein
MEDLVPFTLHHVHTFLKQWSGKDIGLGNPSLMASWAWGHLWGAKPEPNSPTGPRTSFEPTRLLKSLGRGRGKWRGLGLDSNLGFPSPRPESSRTF